MKCVWIVSVLALVSSCGLNGTAQCDFRPKEGRCQERDGLSTVLIAFKQTCGTAGGTSDDGACPRAGIIGGCDLSEASNPVRDWYYSDPTHNITTAAQVMTACQGKPFLSP